MKNHKDKFTPNVLKVMLSDDGEVLLVGAKSVEEYILRSSQKTSKESISDFKILDFIDISPDNKLNIITPFRRLIEEKFDSKFDDNKLRFSPEPNESQDKILSIKILKKIENPLIKKPFVGVKDILLPLNELIDFENDR